MIPSLLGISVVLFTRAGAGAGRSVRRAGHQPGDPARGARRRCAPSSASMTRSGCATCTGSPPWLQGDWGFSFASRIDVDKLILQRLPTTLFVIGAVAAPGHRRRPAGRRAGRDAALFDLRPDRQHLRLRRLLAADLLHRPAADPGLHDPARLAAVRLPRRHQRDRLALATGSTSGSRSCR